MDEKTWPHRAVGWLAWGGAVLTAPLWLPVLALAYTTEVAFLPGEWRLRRRMERAGRRLTRAGLCDKLRDRSGVLIVEWPTPGWRFCRAWWSPQAPEGAAGDRADPRRAREFERRCHDRYTDEEHGTALLVAVWRGEAVVRGLERRFPGVAVVRYCSFFPPE